MSDNFTVCSERKIVVTGASGFVGARIMNKYPNAIAVPSELTRNADDKLVEFIKKASPNVIINAAAIADIGVCQKNPEASYMANVRLQTVLAKVARAVGAKLVSFSSDQVYTGCAFQGPYKETEELPTPANIYAIHKLEAEKRVLDICPSAVMLRATWMYDMPIKNHANRGNFLVNTLDCIKNLTQMRYSSKTFRGITYVRQVVDFLDKVFLLSGGVYNYGSENTLNMFDTAKALIKALGREDLIDKLVVDNGEDRHNLWMNCDKIKGCGILFDTTAQAFGRCLTDYNY